MSLRQALLAFTFAASIVLAVSSNAQNGTCTTVVLSPYSSYVQGINNKGDVVGWYQNASNGNDGFFRAADGSETTIGYPGFTGATQVYGINDNGQAVGVAGPNVFIYNIAAQAFTNVDLHGMSNTGQVAINNAGTVVGSTAVNGMSYGYIANGSRFKLLRPPSAAAASAFSISRSGVVIGHATLPDGSMGFYSYYNGKYARLKTAVPNLDGISPSASAAVGNTTNQSGLAVGYIQQTGQAGYQFQCDGSNSETVALGVNDSGHAVGFYGFMGAQFLNGFIWTPTRR
jgi:hypothetical protein